MRHANQLRNLSAEYMLVNQTDSIDEARHIMFYKFAKPEALLPTSDTLRFHLMRVHAHCAPPKLPSVDTMGWKCCEGRLEPILMSLSPIPSACLEIIACSCKMRCIKTPQKWAVQTVQQYADVINNSSLTNLHA